MSYFSKLLGYLSTIIHFKDINVKEALLASSDINPDGTREITYNEAKRNGLTLNMIKTALNADEENNPNTDIVSFDEFKYFTSISWDVNNLFYDCSNLKSIKFPLIIHPTMFIPHLSGQALLHNTAIEKLDLTGIRRLQGPYVYGTDNGKNTLFGIMSNVTEVWMPDVTELTGNTFRSGTVPNVTKVVISSVHQWVAMEVTSGINQKPNVRPIVYGQTSLYVGNTNPENKVTKILVDIDTIYPNLFSGIKDLQEIELGVPNTSVGSEAFSELGSNVIIKNYDYIYSLDERVFYNCNAQGINGVPASITRISIDCYRGSSITSCESNTLIEIKANAFQSSAITTVKIPNCVTISGAYGGYNQGVFASCTNLLIAEINAVTAVPSSIFYGCTKLTNCWAKQAISVGAYSFYNCKDLIKIYINKNITTIDYNAFNGCSSLEYIKTVDTANNDVQGNLDLSTLLIIGYSAFKGCSLIQCPSDFTNLTKIGSESFRGCIAPSTTTYVILRKNDTIVEYTSEADDVKYSPFPVGVTTVYVPDALLSDYQNDTAWNHSNINLTFVGISQLPT